MTSIGEYIYDHMSTSVLMKDMAFSDEAPRPGERLPEVDLPSTDGSRIRSADLQGKPFLLITGSYSCPMTASSNPVLKRLHQQFGSVVEFIMLHVREAHPGEHREQPRTMEEKVSHARALEQRDALPWRMAVDDPRGTMHRALDEKPNAVYLVDEDSVIVYRGLWAGDEKGLTQALECVARGERPHEPESQRLLVPMAMGIGKMREMTQQSGPRAEWDLWRSAPPVAAMAWLADLYRPLPPMWRTVAAAATVMAGVTALIAVTRVDRRRG